ncbi:hypothetical protein C8R44DRAFT_739742 [Mycena epipterygia]|nr:hypothetical protein C8R44DRAFT_739742 [Mycena epipterygia]
MKFTTASAAVTALTNLGYDVVNSRKDVVDLSYRIATLKADYAEQQEVSLELLEEKNSEIDDLSSRIATLEDEFSEQQELNLELLEEKNDEIHDLKVGGVELLEENDRLELVVEHLTQDLDLQQATADQFGQLANDQQVIVEAGIFYVERLSEELYRTEARARDTQLLLMDDLDRKKDTIEAQEEELAKLHKKNDAANAHVATLEAKIVADGAKYRALCSNGLANAQKVNNQADKIAAFSATIRALEDRAAATLASKAAAVDRANADAMTITRQDEKIKQLEARILGLEENAAQALAKDIEDGKRLAKRARRILRFEAKVKKLEVEAAEVAARALVEQLRASEHVEALGKRALEAKEQIATLQREKVETANRTNATIAELAVLHAKKPAAARTRTIDANLVDVSGTAATTVPQPEIITSAIVKSSCQAAFTLHCSDHFSTTFVVRADSAFTHASVTQLGSFAKDGRKIVRAASSHVAPRLFRHAAAAAGLA